MSYDPSPVRVVPRELLAQLAATGAPPPPPSPSIAATGNFQSRLLVERWLQDRGVGFRVKPEPDGIGRTVYVLDQCPFDSAHRNPDACIMQGRDGKMSAHCFHNSCTGRGWQEFKKQIGKPGNDHYDPPPARNGRVKMSRPTPSVGEPSRHGTGEDHAPTGPKPAAREVHIDPQAIPVAQTMDAITDVLLGTRDCYSRVEQLVRVKGDTISPVLAAAELAGLLNQHAEVIVSGGEGPEFKPLPTSYANTWLNHPGQFDRFPPIKLFTHNPVYTLDWRLAASGYDPGSGIYNAGPEVEPRETTEYLDRLLEGFCFRTPGDRTNYVGMLVTALLIPRFIGSKPAVLFNGNQPGLGKTILAQIIAILRDGKSTETATYNPNDEEFEKRLGAIVRRGTTTIVIDNAKANGRNPRIDSACLERSITDAVLSFRLLGYSKEIRAENAHIFCITANTPDVSRDLVTRSVVVSLYHEGDPAKRIFAIPDPEGYAEEHRIELLGELIGMVERWRVARRPMAAVNSRFNKKGWGPIIGGILQASGRPDFLANAETAAAELDDTRREFTALVAAMTDHSCESWSCAELAWLSESLRLFPAKSNEESAHGRSTRIGMLASRFLGDRFVLPDGRKAIFQRIPDRKGSIYPIAVLNAPHDRDR